MRSARTSDRRDRPGTAHRGRSRGDTNRGVRDQSGRRVRLRERQHGRNEHDRRFRPTRRRLVDDTRRFTVLSGRRRYRHDRRIAGCDPGRRATVGTCSPWTPEATRSPCWRSERRLAQPRRQPGLVRRHRTRQHRRPRPARSTWPTRATEPAAATTQGSGWAADGRLKPLSGSTVPLPATALPGDILFNGTGKNLIGIEVGTTDPSTFLIDSFRSAPTGG